MRLSESRVQLGLTQSRSLGESLVLRVLHMSLELLLGELIFYQLNSEELLSSELWSYI